MATQKPCYLQYFQTLGQAGNSSAPIIIVSPGHTPTAKQFTRDRPFLPLFGVSQNAITGFFEPLAIATQKANIPATFRQMAISCYNASKNSAVDGFGGTASFFVEGRFDQYLFNKIGDDATRLNRYKNGFEIIVDFWNNLDPAATAQQYQDQLMKLRELALMFCDKQLYVAPGTYLFTALDPFAVAYSAWLAATPTLAAIVGLEINSIG